MKRITLGLTLVFASVACTGGSPSGQKANVGSDVSTSRPSVSTAVTPNSPPSSSVERVNVELRWIGGGGGNVFADPPVLSCGSAQGGVQRCTLPRGQEVVLTAEPLPGGDFLGWGEACSAAGTSETCVLTVEGESTIEVLFR